MIHQRILGSPKFLAEIKRPVFYWCSICSFLNKDLRKIINQLHHNEKKEWIASLDKNQEVLLFFLEKTTA